MATRNERKRRARARLAELQDAATKALALEAERQSQPADPALCVEYPDFTRFSPHRTRGQGEARHGIIENRSGKRKFREREAPLPLDIPENRTYISPEGAILRGEKRKRYIR